MKITIPVNTEQPRSQSASKNRTILGHGDLSAFATTLHLLGVGYYDMSCSVLPRFAHWSDHTCIVLLNNGSPWTQYIQWILSTFPFKVHQKLLSDECTFDGWKTIHLSLVSTFWLHPKHLFLYWNVWITFFQVDNKQKINSISRRKKVRWKT